MEFDFDFTRGVRYVHGGYFYLFILDDLYVYPASVGYKDKFELLCTDDKGNINLFTKNQRFVVDENKSDPGKHERRALARWLHNEIHASKERIRTGNQILQKFFKEKFSANFGFIR